MSIHRSGPTPAYYEYVCKRALIPHHQLPSRSLQNIIAPGQSVGLQRFAVGTALLVLLHDQVLAPTPNRPGDAAYFAPLIASVITYAPYYHHNDQQLLNHPRKAVRGQYEALRRSIETWIISEFDAGRGAQLAQGVVPLFVSRQVAIDIYFNFVTPVALMNTFLGINTVRVDLGPIDLLRANLVERAASSGWSEAEVEDLENEYTDVFTSEDKPKQQLLPFVNGCLKCIEPVVDGGDRVIPSWKGALSKIS
jgi:hypothetical protein